MGAAFSEQDVVTVMRSGREKLMVILYLRKLCGEREAAPLFAMTFVPIRFPPLQGEGSGGDGVR